MQMSSWRSAALALVLAIGLPAGAAAMPLSSGAGAIGVAAGDFGSDLIQVKKGGKHFGKAHKAKHFKFKHARHHGRHYGWHRGRHYGWRGHYARAYWHCHRGYRYGRVIRYCHHARH